MIQPLAKQSQEPLKEGLETIPSKFSGFPNYAHLFKEIEADKEIENKRVYDTVTKQFITDKSLYHGL